MMLSMRGAVQTAQESKKLMGYSKQWLPGDTMRLFFPAYQINGQWEIAVGAVWGHKVNKFDDIGLKTVFIPSLTEIDSETATPIGPPDITYQFSQIAGVFVSGAKHIEEMQIAQKKWPNEASRQEALKKLEHKYDVKNNMNAEKPAIGRLTYTIYTEVLCMKYNNGVPDTDSATVVSFPLSSEKCTKLQTILDDAKYQPNEGESYFEVEWKYPSNPDKGQSAKASTPSGLTAEYRMAVAHPEAYAKIEGLFGQMSKDSEAIVRRATKKVSEPKIRSALTQYAISQSENLDAYIEDDEEVLLKHVDLVHELGVMASLSNVELVEKLKAELNARPVEEATSLPDIATQTAGPEPALDTGSIAAATAAPDLGAATAAPDLGATAQPAVDVSGVTGAPTMSDLLNNAGMAGLDDAELVDMNLEMM